MLTDAQVAAKLDAMQGAEDRRVWEALNKEDPNAQAAAELLKKAIKSLEEAESYLRESADKVDATPESLRIDSLERGVEDMEIAIRMQTERMV